MKPTHDLTAAVKLGGGAGRSDCSFIDLLGSTLAERDAFVLRPGRPRHCWASPSHSADCRGGHKRKLTGKNGGE